MEEDRSKKFSPSKLDCYKTCPRQYKFRYIDRLKGDTQSVEAFLGGCVHTGFEELYAGLMHGKRMTEDEVLRAYAAAWDAGFSDKVVFRDARYGPADWRRTGEDCVRSYYRAHAPFEEDKTVAVEKRIGFALAVGDPETGESVEASKTSTETVPPGSAVPGPLAPSWRKPSVALAPSE